MTNDGKVKARDEKHMDIVIRFANDMHSVSLEELHEMDREANYQLRTQKIRHSSLSSKKMIGRATQVQVDECEIELLKAEGVKGAVTTMLKVKHQYTQEEV